MKNYLSIFVSLFFLAAPTTVFANPVEDYGEVEEQPAEDIGPMLEKVKSLASQGKYTQALEELGWAQKELEKLNVKRIKTVLPDAVDQFKGGKTETSSAMGMTNISRAYENGSGVRIEVALTSGSPGGAGQGLGGLAALGQMAAMMGGGSPGNESVRIDGRTAMLETPEGSNRAKVTVFLDGGAMLNAEMEGSRSTSTLRTFVQGLNLSNIEAQLKGK